MSASFVSSAQKYFGYSSVYRFQYQSAAPFVPTGGLAPFFGIPAENARPVIEPLGAGYEAATGLGPMPPGPPARASGNRRESASTSVSRSRTRRGRSSPLRGSARCASP